MIDIIKHVTDTLKPLGLTVAFQALPSGMTPPNQYITFFEVIANPSFEAADRELETERLIQLNVWSKGNYYQLVEDIKRLMESAGYQRTTEFDGVYQDGDSHFNKVLRFVFFDEY